MGSKNSSYIARLIRRTPRKEYLKIAIFQSLCGIASFSYSLSLEGGEVDYLISIIGYLSFVLISSLLLNIIVAICIYYTCTGWVRGINYVFQVLILALTLTYDMGTDITNHGQYNLLVYFLILLPILISFFLYKLCFYYKNLVKSWTAFLASNTLLIIFLYFNISFSMENAVNNWYLGLDGNSLIASWPNCTLTRPGLPWPSMLPHRTMNFFTGLESCGSRYNFSSLSHNFFSSSCPNEGLIIEQPDYISMRNDMFVLTETGFEVYNETRSLEKISKVPAGYQGVIKSEWFQAICNGYENYYIQNVVKPEVKERLEKTAKKRTVKPMNLVLFMMDTVSRVQFFRKMREMTELLEEFNKTGQFETYQFFRIISNGFNTEYNTRAMYSGSQLRQNRRGRPYWDFLSGQGNVAAYINGFCEDWMSVFMKTKFKGMDHTVFYPWCHPEFHPFEKTFGNFAGPFSILRRCINGVLVHDYIFNYIHEIWKNYQDFGKIIHVSFQEGHEGTGEVLRTLSPSMANFFRVMNETRELENTVVVLTSDHGSHMGPYFMSGDMGKFEQKLPLLIMMFPKKFLSKYPNFRVHLKKNEQNLVSHYDTHWTLRHLATLPEFGGEVVENFETETWHEEVWDCELNLYHMEVVHMLEEYVWRRALKRRFVDRIFKMIEACFYELKVSPKRYENITKVDLSQIKSIGSDEGYYVGDVIWNLDTLYWFEDAYQDINKNYLKGNEDISSVSEYLKNVKNAEKKSWETLKAPGIGRYLFGRSLMKYSDLQNCEEAGIVDCVCDEKSEIHEDFSKIG